MSGEPVDPAARGPADPDSSSDIRVLLVMGAAGVGVALLVMVAVFGNAQYAEPPVLDLEGVSGEVAAALTQSRQSVLASPDSAQAWGYLGMQLRAHEFGPEAETCFQEAQRLDPQDWRWPYLLGVSWTYTNLATAEASFRQAIALQPDYAPARHRLVDLLLGQARVAEARRELDEIWRSNPEDPRVLLGLARVEWRDGNVEQSRQWAEKSAARMRGQRATHELLSQIYHSLGQREAALHQKSILDSLPPGKTNWEDPVVAEVLSLRRDAEFAVQDAQALFRGQQPQLAIRKMQQTVQQHPERMEFRAELGRMLIVVQDLRQAASVLDEAIQLHPHVGELSYLRGAVHFGQAQLQQAIRCFREAIEKKPDHAGAHDYLGQCYLELGQRPQAIDAFRNAIRFDPTLANAHACLGHLLVQRGDHGQGLPHLETAVELDPHHARAKHWLANAQASQPDE